MKEILLTQGKVAIVDDADYEYLSKYKWHAIKYKNGFYAGKSSSRKIGAKRVIHMHRFILSPEKNKLVDHIDGNGLNNSRSNLRITDYSKNGMNRKKEIGLSSKYKGVSYRSKTNRWRSLICINRKQIEIGVYKSEIEAAIAYNKKAIELYGEYSNLNII
jgi:hypothetical protein